MTRAEQIEQLALGELSPEEGAKLVRLMATKEELHEELYLALRSCVWKALDSRRRDAELNAWMEVVSRAASRFADNLSSRLEGFVELLQISSMVAEVERRRDPLDGRHARKMLVVLREVNGPMAKKQLMRVLHLKGSTLTQAVAPLLNHGWIKRESVGREVEYSLTPDGLKVIDQREPRIPDPDILMDELKLAKKYHSHGLVAVMTAKDERRAEPGWLANYSSTDWEDNEFTPNFAVAINDSRRSSERTREREVA